MQVILCRTGGNSIGGHFSLLQTAGISKSQEEFLSGFINEISDNYVYNNLQIVDETVDEAVSRVLADFV